MGRKDQIQFEKLVKVSGRYCLTQKEMIGVVEETHHSGVRRFGLTSESPCSLSSIVYKERLCSLLTDSNVFALETPNLSRRPEEIGNRIKNLKV